MTGDSTAFLASLGIKLPIIQAPMAGVDTPELAIAVAKAGGLGSLACAMLSPDEIHTAWRTIRLATDAPVNLNFFCHQYNPQSPAQQNRWKQCLAPYYQAFGLDIECVPPSANRVPFDEIFCTVVEAIKPPVVSFHFGLPPLTLLMRVKKSGAIVFSSATTVDEALWLEQHGCDVIIAQGWEAGGHRATFLNTDLDHQPDTFSLLKSIIDKVKRPVIAAGGIANAHGVRDALSHGAAAAQLGTAYLFCPEARVSPLYRDALCGEEETAVTNVFSGRPARGLSNRFIREMGRISPDAPEFPHAAALVNPLRQASEKAGLHDFMQMWSGINRVPHAMGAEELTRFLYRTAS